MAHPEHPVQAHSLQALFAKAEQDIAHTEYALDIPTVVLATNGARVLMRAVLLDKTLETLGPVISSVPGESDAANVAPSSVTPNASEDLPQTEDRASGVIESFGILAAADEIPTLSEEEFARRARDEFNLNESSRREQFASEVIAAAARPFGLLKHYKDRPRRTFFPLTEEGRTFNTKVNTLSRTKRAMLGILGGLVLAGAAYASHVTYEPLEHQGTHEPAIEEILEHPTTNGWQEFDAEIMDGLVGISTGVTLFLGIRGRLRISMARETAQHVVEKKIKAADSQSDTQ